MTLDSRHMSDRLVTLAVALGVLQTTAPTDPLYEVYRLAVIKSLELTIELNAKLLRKALRTYSGTPRSVDTMTFNETFRAAGQVGIIDTDAVARWLRYRANRNSTAHDYGESSSPKRSCCSPSISTMRVHCFTLFPSAGNEHRSYRHPPHDLDRIVALCQLFLPEATVWAYGSRVNGSARPMSDLDLVVRHRTDPERRLSDVALLAQAISDSTIAIPVDIRQWATLPPHFRAEISRTAVVVLP